MIEPISYAMPSPWNLKKTADFLADGNGVQNALCREAPPAFRGKVAWSIYPKPWVRQTKPWGK